MFTWILHLKPIFTIENVGVIVRTFFSTIIIWKIYIYIYLFLIVFLLGFWTYFDDSNTLFNITEISHWYLRGIIISLNCMFGISIYLMPDCLLAVYVFIIYKRYSYVPPAVVKGLK